jgi:hypothetical protein
MTRQIRERQQRGSRAGTFDVYRIPADALLVGRLKGVLEGKTVQKIIEFVESIEIVEESGFNRFCDLTLLEGIELSSDDILQAAARRSAFNPNCIPVKSAFLATDPLAFGIARMYEQMLNSPRIEVRVWSDMHAAADWLGVNMDRLLF